MGSLYVRNVVLKKKKVKTPNNRKILAVDGSYIPSVKIGEYRGVLVYEGSIIEQFRSRQFSCPNNNFSEYMAIVHGIKWIIDSELFMECTLFSDSQTAISWVKNGVNTSAVLNQEWQNRINKSEAYLNDHWTELEEINVSWWNKREHGEIPADYGRKIITQSPGNSSIMDDVVMWFGKYKGERLSTFWTREKKEYLKWCIENKTNLTDHQRKLFTQRIQKKGM